MAAVAVGVGVAAAVPVGAAVAVALGVGVAVGVLAVVAVIGCAPPSSYGTTLPTRQRVTVTMPPTDPVRLAEAVGGGRPEGRHVTFVTVLCRPRPILDALSAGFTALPAGPFVRRRQHRDKCQGTHS